MQVVGKKILLQNRSVAYKVNKPLLINNYNQQLVATEPISADLVGLPIEVLYRIFDYLDAQTILLSLQYICRRLRDKNITGQSFFPNVTILYLKFHDNWPSDGIEFVSSLIDMSRATTLELCYDRKIDSISDSIVHVEKLFGQAVNVSILVVFGYRRLYYRFKWEKLCSVIPHHVKHLSSSASDSEDMKNILDHLKHLWSIRFQWPTGIISEDKGTCSREIINNLKMKKQNFKYQYDDFELQIWLSNP
ncbi:unnamed protein product [Rotaria magnacalcarata]|uniref:F-box domain-containing protein n=1 Tax=Rotaria magnacalcarata TaxID=392030 RepID=A0A815ZYJ2_9BILA|nr:unnamed protein product [Rotaria magnacalcarata]CAF1590353.1 unnamed protein product [Rotaria magnacalcarata]